MSSYSAPIIETILDFGHTHNYVIVGMRSRELVSYKEQKNIYSFLSFDNLSAERFLNYLLANYAFLNFDLLSVRSLNFPKISALFLIGPFFIIGDCV